MIWIIFLQNVIATQTEEKVKLATPMVNVAAKKDSMEENVIR